MRRSAAIDEETGAMAAQLKVVGTGGESGSMDRQKALEAALAQIDRAFGKGSAMKLGSREKIEIETISTGSLGLDIALGVGGLPRGRVVEIYGPESSGKTTLALHAIAEAQKDRRHRRLRRCRACARPGLCQEAGRRHRRTDRLAARHRRAGAGDRRHAGALERDRRAGRSIRSPRWCRAPRSRARWATAMSACRRG